MEIYQHILVVGNALANRDAELIRLAIKAHPELRVRLSLVYVVPKVPACYFQVPSAVAFSHQLQVAGKERLAQLAQVLGAEASDCWLKIGVSRVVVKRLAKVLGVDAIISNTSDDYHSLFARYLSSQAVIGTYEEIPRLRSDANLDHAILSYIRQGGIIAY